MAENNIKKLASLDESLNLQYFIEQRDDVLIHFCNLIKCDVSDKKIKDCFNQLMKKRTQLQLIEDLIFFSKMADTFGKEIKN